MSDFSEDFFFEILSWLPVSSLLRYRLVCKCWCALITQNSSFAKSQLLRANATQSDNPMVLFKSNDHGTLFSSKYADFASLSLTNVYENLMKHAASLNEFKFVASCNGLICIKMYLKHEVVLCLWNPSTCEIKELPPVPCKGSAESYRLIAFGFGCNRALDDYKVIRILQYASTDQENYISSSYAAWDDEEDNLYFVVYTLGTNSWKRIRDMPCKFRCLEDLRGLHISGGLHWIGSVSTTEPNDEIISFDIENEEFREVPKPEFLDGMENARLEVLGGCLCIFKFVTVDCLDVWMMKDYGVKESWTKLFTTTELCYGFYQDKLKPLWLLKNGEVLIDMDKNLVRSDPKWETFDYVGPGGFNCGWFDTVIYIESLVHLKSRTYAWQYVTSSKEKTS